MKSHKLDWEANREFLVDLRKQGKTFGEIQTIIFNKFGVIYTQARLSQIFTKWNSESNPSVRSDEEKQLEAEYYNDAAADAREVYKESK